MDSEISIISAQEFDALIQVEQAQEMKETTIKIPSPVTIKSRRRPSYKVDIRGKLKRCRKYSKCRPKKKNRYQYIEKVMAETEKSVFFLREELEKYRQWCIELDAGKIPEGLPAILEEMNQSDELSTFNVRSSEDSDNYSHNDST